MFCYLTVITEIGVLRNHASTLGKQQYIKTNVVGKKIFINIFSSYSAKKG